MTANNERHEPALTAVQTSLLHGDDMSFASTTEHESKFRLPERPSADLWTPISVNLKPLD